MGISGHFDPINRVGSVSMVFEFIPTNDTRHLSLNNQFNLVQWLSSNGLTIYLREKYSTETRKLEYNHYSYV